MENSEENVYNISIISTFQQRVDFVLIDQDNEIKLVPDRIKCGGCHVTEIVITSSDQTR